MTGARRRRSASAYAGDDWVAEPHYCSTKAITIEAGPEAIWPWLVQIGRGRGGLYSIDWLDEVFGILDGPSAEEILPEFQHLEAGDVIPIGGSNGWPVLSVEEPRALVLGVTRTARGGRGRSCCSSRARAGGRG